MRDDEMGDQLTLFLGELWFFEQNSRCAAPETEPPTLKNLIYGAMLVDCCGKIVTVGDREFLCSTYPQAKIVDFGKSLIFPGFVDSQIALPNLRIMGSLTENLESWQEEYRFPEERRFADDDYAKVAARDLLDEVIKQGTTSVSLLSSVHWGATERLFEASLESGLRAVIGKMSMDQYGPEGLRLGLQADYQETRALIEAWHGREDRLYYSLSPRALKFCSPPLLKAIAQLKALYPDLRFQTEITQGSRDREILRKSFSWEGSQIALFEALELLGENSCISQRMEFISEDRDILRGTQTSVAYCPSSSFFFGKEGLIKIKSGLDAGLNYSLGSQFGFGKSASMWSAMDQAYQHSVSSGQALTPSECFYLATIGGARALGLEHKAGNLSSGLEADFQVVNLARNHLLMKRLENCYSDEERLGVIIRTMEASMVQEVFVAGKSISATDINAF